MFQPPFLEPAYYVRIPGYSTDCEYVGDCTVKSLNAAGYPDIVNVQAHVHDLVNIIAIDRPVEPLRKLLQTLRRADVGKVNQVVAICNVTGCDLRQAKDIIEAYENHA